MSPSTTYQSKAPGCARCGRPIVFVRNLRAKDKHGNPVETYIAVDPVPDSEGNVCAFRDQRGRRWSGLSGWPISAENPHDPAGRLYMPHAAICPVRPGPAGQRPPRNTEPVLPLEFADDNDDEDEEEMPAELHEQVEF